MAESNVTKFSGRKQNKSTPILSCLNCNKYVKGKRKISCKCTLFVFCTEKCRDDSDHFGTCKLGDPSQIDSSTREKLISQVETSLADNLKKEVDDGLSTIAYNTFEDLKCKEENPTACWRVAVALMNNNKEANGPYFCALPDKYSQLSYLERHALALKWFKKASILGHPLAMSSLGKMILHLRTELNLDGREGLDWSAKASQRGDENSTTEFEKNSLLVGGIKGLIHMLLNDKQNGRIIFKIRMYQAADLGGLLVARCLSHLKSNNWVTSKKVWGLAQIKLFDQTIQKLSPLQVPIIPIFPNKESYQYSRNKHTIRYSLCPNFDLEPTRKDLEMVCKGLKDIDYTNHIRYGCKHVQDSYAPPEEICRICFRKGAKRVKAVSLGAYAISKDFVCADTSGSPKVFCYEVIYQESDKESIEKEMFMGYCKEEINTVLYLLSENSVDIDPRVVCLNPCLYWSIIWFYGSVHKALDAVGGKQMQRKGFGPHQEHTDAKDSEEEGDDMFKEVFMQNPVLKAMENMRLYGRAKEPSECPGKDGSDNENYKEFGNRPAAHFMGNLVRKSGEWRYVCGNDNCSEIEDAVKFMKCAGCKDSLQRRYCSKPCQHADWKLHKKECDWKKN